METTDTKLIKKVDALHADVRELKAMVAQLGPVAYNPPTKVKIAALRAQGISVRDYLLSQKKPRKPYGSAKRGSDSKQ